MPQMGMVSMAGMLEELGCEIWFGRQTILVSEILKPVVVIV